MPTTPPVRHAPAALFASALAAAGPAPAHAGQLDTLTVTAPAAWASGCSGIELSAGVPGTMIGHGEADCQSALTSSATGTAGASTHAADASVPMHLDGQASAGFGVIRLGTQTTAPSTVRSPGAVMQAGWEDRLFLAAPTPADVGRTATLNFSLWIEGHLEAQGFNSGVKLGVLPYVDHATSWTGGLEFKGQGFTNAPFSKDIAGGYGFSLPFQLGTAFDFGLVARASSGPASFASNSTPNVGLTDFGHTLRWGGITSVVYNGQALDPHFESASGIDWTLAAPVPEPAPWRLLGAGAALLAARRLWSAGRRHAD